MRVFRRAIAFTALILLARAVSASTEAASSAADRAVATPPRIEQAHLLIALRSKIPIEPVALLADPYISLQGGSVPRASTATVCGVRFESDRVHYRMSTFADAAAARTSGFSITHFGACGTCSTLQDLAVYLEMPDLTAPVRRCGISWGASASLTCLKHLGFSAACAQTWMYNVRNTRRQCFSVCLWSWIEGEAPTREDGRLNACLQCDEDRSGPAFKAAAGRTRRNSGIRSSIPRPNDAIAPVVHDYVPDTPQ